MPPPSEKAPFGPFGVGCRPVFSPNSLSLTSSQPMIVTYHPKTAALTFQDLLPGVGRDPSLVSALKALVDEHGGASVPLARRIDPRRVGVRCRVRAGNLSLAFSVKGSNHLYAVQRGLNLVNLLFLHLQSYYPEYLVAQFGFSSE